MHKIGQFKVLFLIIAFVPLLIDPKTGSAQIENDVSGFRNTDWSMGVEEVSDSLGSRVSRVMSGNIHNSSYKELTIKNYEIKNLKYKVDFFFSTEDSTLSIVEVTNQPYDGTSASFEILSKLMVRKYGEPTSTSEDRTDIGSYGELKKSKTWVFPTTTIELSFRSGYDSPDVSGETTLRYTPTEGESTNKI